MRQSAERAPWFLKTLRVLDSGALASQVYRGKKKTVLATTCGEHRKRALLGFRRLSGKNAPRYVFE